MRTKVFFAALLSLFIAVAGNAQDHPTNSDILAGLQGQYTLTKTPSGNADISDPGSVLVAQKSNLIGSPKLTFANNYKGGRIKQGLLDTIVTTGGENRTFQQGDKFYVNKIESKGNNVVFTLCSADLYDGIRYYLSVAFQFSKGYLVAGNLENIRQTIGEVFTIEQTGGKPGSEPADSAAQQSPEQEQSAQPVSIEIGQTIDQVVAILGQPEKTVKLGNKQIYVYKDLKITFIDGKVSDVQ